MSDAYEFIHDEETRRMVANEAEEMFNTSSYQGRAIDTVEMAVQKPNSIAAVWLDMVTEIYVAYDGKVSMAYDAAMNRDNPSRISVRAWPTEEEKWEYRERFEERGIVRLSGWYSLEKFENSPNRLRYL